MKTCSSLLRIALIAVLSVVLMPSTGLLAQQQKDGQQQKPAVSDARVAELMKAALEQAGAGQEKPTGQSVAIPQGPVVDLHVEDAVGRAMENNIDLGVQKLNPQLQDLSLAGIRAAYAPTFTSTVRDNSNASISDSTIAGASAGVVTTTQSYTYNFGVSKVLPWTGGTANINFNNSRSITDSNTYTIRPNYQSSLQLSLTQSMWRNFRIDNTRQQLWNALISRKVADINLRSSMLTTAANTRNAYWDLVYAVQNVEVARQSLALADKLVQDNQARVDTGTMAPLDVVTAQSQAAQARQSLVQAEQTRAQNEITLKRLIVGSTSDPLWNSTLNPVDRPDPQVAPTTIDLEGAIRNALNQRTDLIASRESMRQSENTLKYNKNQTLPDANVTASYSASGKGGNIYERSQVVGGSPVLKTPGGYVDALNLLGRLKVPSWSVQLQFNYPIGTSAADANYARAKVQYQQAQANLKALELRVATDVTTAALNVRSTLQQVETARASRELAAKRLEAEQSKFDLGMQTNYFVVQAQRDLASAQQSELQAILNYRKALVNFQLLQETSSSGGSGGGSGVTATGGGA